MPPKRKLRVFLCHASQDKPAVRDLYRQLAAEPWIDPWLDEEKLLPGQDWNLEIEKAVESSDAVVVCLSNNSVTKEGYVQKELRKVLSMADEKPEGVIYMLPVRLNDCPLPRKLQATQAIDYFPKSKQAAAYEKLKASLKIRKDHLRI
ncbi:MAG TPA: toll/interleukin-1 receptor domain-containing protein [Anaerolineales bacterium]|nr:toll/interleukin-1 receptor domain-containing protein [Anaerolineales bacterium]